MIIVRPNLYVPGTVIRSAEVNDDFDTLYNDYNGNIDNSNISNTAEIDVLKLEDMLDMQIILGDTVTTRPKIVTLTGALAISTTGVTSLTSASGVSPIGTIVPFYDFNAFITFDTNIWRYCDGTVLVYAASPLNGKTLPDLSNRYLVGFGTEAGGDIGTAAWNAAAVGNASHQVNLQHLHDISHGHVDTLSFSVDAHTHNVPAHYHGDGTLEIAAGGSHAHDIKLGSLPGGANQVLDSHNDNTPGWVSGLTDTSTHAHANVDFSGTVGNAGGSDGDAAFATGNASVTTTTKGGSVTALAGNSGNAGSTTQDVQPRSIRVRFIMRVL